MDRTMAGTCGYPSSSAGHTQRIQYQSISVSGMSGWKPVGWHVFVQSLGVWIWVTRSKLPAEFGRMRNCEKFVSQRKNHKNPRKRKRNTTRSQEMLQATHTYGVSEFGDLFQVHELICLGHFLQFLNSILQFIRPQEFHHLARDHLRHPQDIFILDIEGKE